MNNLEVVLHQEEISKKIQELGQELAQKYKNNNPVVIGIMKGAIYFLTELTQNMPIELEVDLMGLSSYGNSATTSGKVRITKDISVDVTDRHVIIVEDIVDTGTTLEYLKNYFVNQEAKSVETVSLFIKTKSINNKTLPDKILFEVPNDFLVGYGLDYQNKYRHLKDVCKIEV